MVNVNSTGTGSPPVTTSLLILEVSGKTVFPHRSSIIRLITCPLFSRTVVINVLGGIDNCCKLMNVS